MKHFKKIFAIVLVFCMTLGCFVVVNAAEHPFGTLSGNCNETVTWSYDKLTKTLTIGGYGAMTDYTGLGMPWQSFRDEINNIIIENGITHIGDLAFLECSPFTNISFPNSVTSIGTGVFMDSTVETVEMTNSVTELRRMAFTEARHLKEVKLSNNITTIEEYTFSNCERLDELYIPDSVTEIKTHAFWHCESLNEITIPSGVSKIEYGTFADCYFLYNIYFLNKDIEIELSYSFPPIPEYTTIHAYCNNKDGIMGRTTAYGYAVKYDNNFVSLGHVYSEKNKTTCTICGETATNPVLVTEINVNKNNIYFENVGDTTTITTTAYPENATNKTLHYSSSNRDVVTIDENGLVTAKGPGSATIYITAASGKRATVKVTVKKPVVTSISLSAETTCIAVRDTVTINVTVTPENAINKELLFKSSSERIATVDANGVVTGHAPGTTTITVGSRSGITNSITITVYEVKPETISAYAETYSLFVGEETQIISHLTPTNTTNQKLGYYSSNTRILKVSDKGVVYACGEGTATITVYCDSDINKRVDLTFKTRVKPSFTVNSPSSLDLDETGYIGINPNTFMSYTKEFIYSGDSIIIDENGNITPLKAGTTEVTIKVVFEDGVENSKTVTITVNPDVQININNNNKDVRCSMCDTYEASIGTPMEVFYKIFHTIAHFFATMFG